MTLRRFASLAGALVVATIAALASYSHMRGLAMQYGQPEWIADLLPVSVDGIMVVATLALGDGRRNRWSAWLAFWVGVAASVLANVLAAPQSTIARCISAWPAVAFLLVVEVITRGGRGRGSSGVATATAEAVDGPQAVPADAVASSSVVATPVAEGVVVPMVYEDIGDGRTENSPLELAEVAAVAELIPPARDAAAELAKQGRPLSRETLTEKLRERGHAISNARASTLVKIVRASA